jgi:hypothetical protein
MLFNNHTQFNNLIAPAPTMMPLRIRLHLALHLVNAILTPRCHTVTDAARNADAPSLPQIPRDTSPACTSTSYDSDVSARSDVAIDRFGARRPPDMPVKVPHMAACPNRRSRQVDARSAIAEEARTGKWPLIACRCHVNTVDRIVTAILAHRSG